MFSSCISNKEMQACPVVNTKSSNVKKTINNVPEPSASVNTAVNSESEQCVEVNAVARSMSRQIEESQ